MFIKIDLLYCFTHIKPIHSVRSGATGMALRLQLPTLFTAATKRVLLWRINANIYYQVGRPRTVNRRLCCSEPLLQVLTLSQARCVLAEVWSSTWPTRDLRAAFCLMRWQLLAQCDNIGIVLSVLWTCLTVWCREMDVSDVETLLVVAQLHELIRAPARAMRCYTDALALRSSDIDIWLRLVRRKPTLSLSLSEY